ncbi:MAG: ribonuclease P protein component [Candidatus Paceibacterota bacterium]|jgi:ribonuclease P protein component
MLKKKYRLTSSFLFQKIFNQGEFKENKFFVVVYTKNNLTHPRFGIVTSAKTFPLAVDRNSLKRKIRAILNNCVSLFKEGFDIVILTKKGVLDKPSQEIEETLNELLVSLS